MPNEFALIDAAGTVTLHSFYCDESSNEVDAVYTQLEPGTTHIPTFNFGHQFHTMMVTQPSGSVVKISNNGRGRGVKQQVMFQGPPCTECNFDGINSSISATFDRTAVQLRGVQQFWRFPLVPPVLIARPEAEYCDRN
jgi:hypothetical protein